MASVNKTIRFTKEDFIGIKDIMSKDPKCDNPSKAMYYGFKDARENGFDIKRAANYKVKSDKEVEIEASEYIAAKSFSTEEEDWNYALDEYRTQLKVERVRISSLARLIISNYRMRLNNSEEISKPEIKVKTNTIDGVDLLQKVNNHAAELIKAGDVANVLAFIGEGEERKD